MGPRRFAPCAKHMATDLATRRMTGVSAGQHKERTGDRSRPRGHACRRLEPVRSWDSQPNRIRPRPRVIYLLRHGETEWSRAGRKQGHGDSPLTPLGIAQVEACARVLAREIVNISAVHLVSSPLGRACASAEIVRTVLGLAGSAYSVNAFLAEHDYGAWEGLTHAEIEARFPGQLSLRKQDHWRFVIPGGESYALLAERLSGWLHQQDPGGVVVAVAHDMVSRVLRGLYLKLPPQEVLQLTQPHTRIYAFDHGEVRSIEVHEVAA